MNQPTNDIRTLCRQILPPSDSAPAHTCGSPALRGESFCFYHHPTRKRVPSRADRKARERERRLARRTISVPLPRDRTELFKSFNYVISLIAANQIDLRRASLLLKALKTAGKALRE
jgi:hypothetical protein